MNIVKVAQPENVAFVMSLQEFIRQIPRIKESGFNVISIRDSQGERQNRTPYDTIDSAGFDNIYVATFDD